MPKLAGIWGETTLDGDRTIVVDGIEFGVPLFAIVKLVRGSRFDIAHVKIEREVVVLSRLGQLVEDTQQRRHRAVHWSSIPGDFI